MKQVIQVMIADDTDIAREGLKRIMASEEDMEIVGEAATLHETLQKVHQLMPDVLLIDLKWFGDERAGVEAVRRLVREVPETKIIAITVYPHLIQMAREAGAVSALTKEVPRRQLLDEIRAVHALPVVPLTTVAPASGSVPTSEQLTEREKEVLVLLADGLTDKEIATRLKNRGKYGKESC